MVRLKWDALRLAAMSVSVLLGLLLVLGGVANAILKAQGDPAPSWPLVALVTLVGAALLAWPLRRTYREMRRGEAAR